jgi:hypothetical protein
MQLTGFLPRPQDLATEPHPKPDGAGLHSHMTLFEAHFYSTFLILKQDIVGTLL